MGAIQKSINSAIGTAGGIAAIGKKMSAEEAQAQEAQKANALKEKEMQDNLKKEEADLVAELPKLAAEEANTKDEIKENKIKQNYVNKGFDLDSLQNVDIKSGTAQGTQTLFDANKQQHDLQILQRSMNILKGNQKSISMQRQMKQARLAEITGRK